MSNCHQPMSVIRRQQFALKDSFSTRLLNTRLRALKFGMKHFLINPYNVCLNCGLGVQHSSAAGGLGFEIKIYLKIRLETSQELIQFSPISQPSP